MISKAVASGAKDNGREERSAEPARRIAKEMRERERSRRKTDGPANLVDSTKPRVFQSPPAYRFWKPTRGWSLSVFPISHRALFFVRKTARKYTGTGPRTAPEEGGPFHVGGSRVPGPNTFLIEMFIEKLQRIVGK